MITTEEIESPVGLWFLLFLILLSHHAIKYMSFFLYNYCITLHIMLVGVGGLGLWC